MCLFSITWNIFHILSHDIYHKSTFSRLHHSTNAAADSTKLKTSNTKPTTKLSPKRKLHGEEQNPERVGPQVHCMAPSGVCVEKCRALKTSTEMCNFSDWNRKTPRRFVGKVFSEPQLDPFLQLPPGGLHKSIKLSTILAAFTNSSCAADFISCKL